MGLTEVLPSNDDAPWFALRVKPRHEKSVSLALATRGRLTYLPCHTAPRRWSDRTKQVRLPLFPCYLFCRMWKEDRLAVLEVPSVRSIVGFGGRPCAVEEAQIRDVRRVEESGLPAMPWPTTQLGERVQLTAGPLSGLRGVIEQFKGVDRLIVSVELLQRSVAVEIDRRWAIPADSGVPTFSRCRGAFASAVAGTVSGADPVVRAIRGSPA